jgi:membrane peptidoglycan carboxypeptidase
MKDKKNVVFTVACIVISLVMFAIVFFAFYTEKNLIVLNDSDGKAFAKVVWDGYNINYKVKKEYEKEYATYVIKEAKDILTKKGKANKTNIDEYLFSNVTEINTNLNRDIQLELKNADSQNKELKNTSFAIAVTDLKGRVVAIYSNGKDEFLSFEKTYAGSAIKPLSVYAPAIESGKFSWSSTFLDSPVKKVKNDDGTMRDWPANANGVYSH